MATSHGHDPHGHDAHEHGSAPHGPINHETSDIHLDGVAKITIGFTIFMMLVVGVMYGTFHFFGGREAVGQRPVGTMVDQAPDVRPDILSGPNEIEGARMPAGPKLLTDEPANLRDFRAEQRQRLTTYGWVDRGNNVVHMPIARAIELVAERGLPAASQTDEATAIDPAADPAAATPEDGTAAEPAATGTPAEAPVPGGGRD